MSFVKFLLRYSRGTVLAAVIAGIVSGASNTALLALINASLARHGAATRTIALSFVGFCMLVPVSRIISELLLIHLGQNTILDLRVRLSRRILDVPLRRLEEMGAHRILTILTDDVPAIANVVTVIPVLCINLSVLLGSLCYLGWLSWRVLALVLLFLAVGIITYQIPLRWALRLFRLARDEGDHLMDHFRALTAGSKELKLHRGRREAFLGSVLERTARAAWSHNVSGQRIYTLASNWGQLLVFVAVGLVVLALPTVYPAESRMLTGYALVLLYMMTPLEVAMNALPTLGRAGVATQRVEALGTELASYSVDAPRSRGSKPDLGWSELSLEGVTHSYRREGEESSFVLGPIDLSFRPGELVFISGGNGSGKTTLAKLITGLYIPESGRIVFNGRAVDDDSREEYRQQFSSVFSDFYLFDSLLGLDMPNLDDLARDHLARLQLDHKVQVRDGRLTTTDLSQGQRKRLALLTAYLEDRPIYLFDEWAADQDPVFRDLFYHDFLPALKARGKTVLVISHDDRYYGVADRLIKLTYGRIEYDQSPSLVGQLELQSITTTARQEI